MVPPPLQRDRAIGFHCRETDKAFTAGLEARLKGTGLSFGQYLGLGYLVSGDPVITADLAEDLSITVPTCVRLIDRMERDGLVTRRGDPNDRRAKQLIPTAKGVKVWGEVGHLGPELLEQAYEGVSAEELEITLGVLARVRQNLGRRPHGGG